ncbi:LacI family DNA-binding transcriptional regulator [Devosia pacifica]|nr:LacI family DNA-binding transcriptional regulator [Devosia pacifica]
MSEVARRAGVSQATVSLVLNDTGGVRVNADTRARVRQVADEIGYHVWRRSPVGSGSIRTIGFLIDDITSSALTTSSIEAARAAAWENNCVLTVLPTHGESQLERAAIKLLFAQRLVGVIYGAFYTKEVSLPKQLRTASVVLLNCFSADPNVTSFIPRHEEGAYDMTTRLIAAGHRRIAVINGTSSMLAAVQRFEGYRRAMESAQLEIDEDLVAEGNFSLSGAQRMTERFLMLDRPPTAIFCASDKMAIGAYEALKSAGLSLPLDMSVVGFDDDPMGQFLSPPLTTVRVPHAQMGRQAVEFLIDKYNRAEQRVPPGKSLLACPLVERESLVSPKGSKR